MSGRKISGAQILAFHFPASAKPLPIRENSFYLIRSFPVDFTSLHPSGCLWQSITHLPRRLVVVRISPVSGLPPSLPLMSPFGLPSAGCPASARWHVFRYTFPFGSRTPQQNPD